MSFVCRFAFKPLFIHSFIPLYGYFLTIYPVMPWSEYLAVFSIDYYSTVLFIFHLLALVWDYLSPLVKFLIGVSGRGEAEKRSSITRLVPRHR